MNNEKAEPGSINELFEISDLIEEKLGGAITQEISEGLKIAALIRANDLKQEQVEHIKDAAESFMQVCAQVMAFASKMAEKENTSVGEKGRKR